MKKYLLPLVATVALSPAIAPKVHAAETVTKDDNLEYLSIYGSDYGFDENAQSSFQLGADYRFKPVLWNIMRPFVGANVDDEGGVMGYGGIMFDFEVADNLYLTPYTSVGLQDEGSGKDLGGPIEFRSGINLEYALPSQARIGLGINHVSNAGIYDRNPGENGISLSLSIPTDIVIQSFK